ncbi:MAG: hypothetical protein ETSY2_46370 [Candidatus Entotheonella gemina]|uniref:Uncharacterized protein n=1 Tax=Candidatus Entotheonella gemina TaxID=1429439 RepID=W4LFG7_9BACT|nr:MAG: hypothetical protein ETSY2_46370 [Candidatus Entotheonella gemina]
MEGYLTVNGNRFHYIWLRHNCLCHECRHPTSFEPVHDVSELVEPPEPLSVRQQDGVLRIIWKGEASCHESVFPLAWLDHFAYDNGTGQTQGEREAERSIQPVLWDNAWLKAHLPVYYDARSVDLETWMMQLLTLGFAHLNHMEPDHLEPFLSSIGPIYNGNEGLFSAVKTVADSAELANTSHALNLHTDYAYWNIPDLISCLYCVENEAIGGESVMVDGFRIAEDFRRDHPDHFRMLTRIPVQFRQFYSDLQYDYCHTRPILELDDAGTLIRITFAPFHHYIWNLPFDRMAPFYAAYIAFLRYVNNSAYQYEFRLEPGDCLLLDNCRLLHGRRSFQGARHLEVGHLSWDCVRGRQDFYDNKHLYLGN